MNTMKKSIFVFVAILLGATPLYAQFDTWVSAYQFVAAVPQNEYTIPTVVEIPFEGAEYSQDSFLVIEKETQKPVPHRWRDQSRSLATPVQVITSGRLLPLLSDKNPATRETFPINGTRDSQVYFDLQSSDAFTTSQINFSFGRNVTPPDRVGVYALQEDGTQITLLAPTTFLGNRVAFPTVTTRVLQVSLFYTQPLIIEEIAVVEEGQVVEVDQGVRFLAAAGQAYDIYLNPDRQLYINRGETPDLRTDTGVALLPSPPIVANQRYRPADMDADGVQDTLDNCLNIPNLDQRDEDGNGVGDECDDYDRDGVINSMDNCRDVPNERQRDEDADGIGDECDDSESRITEKYDWVLWVVMGVSGLVIISLFVVVARRDPLLHQAQDPTIEN
jgi:Thrombospondin type 3 repeat